MADSSPGAGPSVGLVRIFKNIAWLVGGKGFGALCSLVYLGILSRSLGLKDFGHFSLIFATGQALVAIASFQTWQTVVRFGAEPVHNQDWPRFGRLAWLCATVDLAGVAVGCGIAAVIYFGLGNALALNPAYVNMAFWFNCGMLVARTTTPTGIVRVLDRFDLGTYVEAVVPAGRLIASALILWAGATVGRFLFAWVAFDLISTGLYWFVAWRVAPQALSAGQFGHWRQALEENQGIARFFGATFASSTLDALFKQGPLLAVGYFLGTSTAGVYRLADQLAQGVSRFSQLAARAVFPEFAMANIRESRFAFRRLVGHISLLSGVAGVAVTTLAYFGGEPLLTAVGGEQFARGAPIIVPIVIGTSFELAAVSFDSVLYSLGHTSWPAVARGASVATLAVGIAFFVREGAAGVAWATVVGMVAYYSLMASATLRVLAAGRPASRPHG